MKYNKLIIMVVVLSSILACVIPGVSQPTPAPVDTVDPASLPTIVAFTANAAITQTAAAVTLVPTETPTPAPTVTPPPVYSQYGSALVQQADGSVLFIDLSVGYQMYFPQGWVVVRQGHDEDESNLSEEAVNYPYLTAELSLIKDQDPNYMRVHAFDIAPDHLQEKYVSHIYIQRYEEIRPLNEEVDAMVAEITDQDPNVSVITSGEEIQTSNGVIMTVVDFTAEMTSLVNNAAFMVYEKRVLFHAKYATMLISLRTSAELKDVLGPEYERLLDTIELVQP